MAEETNMNTTAEQTENAAETEQNRQTENQNQQQEKTFTQAEVNSLIERRLAQQKRQHDAQIEQARNEGRSEAERLAKMTEDQRKEAERQESERKATERENALLEREREITRRELRAQAIETLVSRGLPKELAEHLDYADADKCSSSIDTLEKGFRAAVQTEVDKRLAKGANITRGKESETAKETDGERMVKQMNASRAAASKRTSGVLDHYIKNGGR